MKPKNNYSMSKLALTLVFLIGLSTQLLGQSYTPCVLPDDPGNFGVDGDFYPNAPFPGSDDWFSNGTTTGLGVIGVTASTSPSGTEEQVHKAIFDASGVDTRSIEIRTVTDQKAALETDVMRIKTYPLLPKDLEVVGAIFDVKSGKLEKIV